MANILDYLEWRGDLPFEASAFNEVDAVVFSRFSYIPFEGIVPDDFSHTVTVAEAAERFLGDTERMTQVIYEDDLKLLAAMGASRRFGDLLLCGYENQLDEEIQKQFSAVTVKLFGGRIVIWHFFHRFRLSGQQSSICGRQQNRYPEHSCCADIPKAEILRSMQQQPVNVLCRIGF